ncbi:monooxygenase FAD-binding protein [Anopheles sinensis]|uniref:Monooxygenase FAD-binding protein n=1 Tax=Anopheles sinensis TaxID=74873 RepID=A0A084VH87_ANOSI|nr:monooxygenase FAD-binding protein [Anopheles sinensis]
MIKAELIAVNRTRASSSGVRAPGKGRDGLETARDESRGNREEARAPTARTYSGDRKSERDCDHGSRSFPPFSAHPRSRRERAKLTARHLQRSCVRDPRI